MIAGAGKISIALLLLLVAVLASAISPTSYLSSEDKQRLKKVFDSAWSQKDVANLHYAILGFNLLGSDIPESPNTCKFLQSQLDSTSDVESVYHAVAASSGLKGCSLTLNAGQKQALSNALAADDASSSVQTLYQALEASLATKNPVDHAKVARIVSAALKKDDGLLNLGLAFHIASKLDASVDVKPIFERVEDAVVQADEVDGKFLQFEGGLSITGMIVSGAYKLAASLKTPPPISADQAVKFANYFLSRKSVQTAKGAYFLLDVLKMFTENPFHVPVAVTLASPLSISESSPWVRVRVTDLLGNSLGKTKVTLESAKRIDDNSIVMSSTALAPVSSNADDTLFEVNLMKASNRPTRGFYALSLGVEPEEVKEGSKKRAELVGRSGARVTVKVMAEVAVESMELWTADAADGSTTSKVLKASFGQVLSETLEADDHQKVMAKFSVKDKRSGQAVAVHQAFVRLSRDGEEVVFVAEPEGGSKVYKFDLDVGAKAKLFSHKSGAYDVELIVGDATVSNPIQWTVGKVRLDFRSSGDERDGQEERTSKRDAKLKTYEPKPEIKHMFREPEKRPADWVANTFSILVLVPLLLLVVLWMKLGVNVSNFPVSLSAIGFHLGLGGIFALYYVCWLRLDMFTTVKYLCCVSIVTFLCGNSVLAKVASDRKKAGAVSESAPSSKTKGGN